MQLDLFEHSRDVVLRNTAIDALQARDAAAAGRAIAVLEAEYRGDPLAPALRTLLGRLCLRGRAPLDRVAAAAVLDATERCVPAAGRLFGAAAAAWLAPFWRELAAAIDGLPFDPAEERLHAAPLLLRAGEWEEAGERVARIASWRRQPLPLAWKAEAVFRLAGLHEAWPLLAELSWMAPRRAEALSRRLPDAALEALLRRFDAEFESDGGAEEFAWFPAWALVAEPRVASALRCMEAGSGSPAECGARLLLHLLALERQGRHAELIEGRRRLRDLHRPLFDRYMHSR
jgi:hypothetical protein